MNCISSFNYQLISSLFINKNDNNVPIHHDDRTVLIISMKVLDDADKSLWIVIMRPQTVLIRRRLNDPSAEFVIILQ